MTSLALLLAWLPAIAQVESHSCAIPVQDLNRPAEERSYGCYGVRLIAYADALTMDATLPVLSPDKAIARLRDDPKFNKRVAIAYIKWLRKHPGLNSTCKVLTAYNMGPAGALRWMARHDDEMECESRYMRLLQEAAR